MVSTAEVPGALFCPLNINLGGMGSHKFPKTLSNGGTLTPSQSVPIVILGNATGVISSPVPLSHRKDVL